MYGSMPLAILLIFFVCFFTWAFCKVCKLVFRFLKWLFTYHDDSYHGGTKIR